jgi:hypothetical protein
MGHVVTKVRLEHPRAYGEGVGMGHLRGVGEATAPGGGEPTYSAALHNLIFNDDFSDLNAFTSANGSPAFRDRYPRGNCNYPGGPANDDLMAAGTADQCEDDGMITIVPGRGSGKAVRELLGAGASNDTHVGPKSQELGTIGGIDGTYPIVAGPYNHFYATIWFRAKANCQPAEYNSDSIKGLMFYAGSYPNRVEWRPCKRRYGGGNWPDGSTRWTRGGGMRDNDGTGLEYWQTPDGYPPNWNDYNDEQWHRFTTYIAAGDPLADADRGQRVWIDGAFIYDEIGKLPTRFDMWGNGVGIDWNGDAMKSGWKYGANYGTNAFSAWGNFVSSVASENTTQFWLDYADIQAWTLK